MRGDRLALSIVLLYSAAAVAQTQVQRMQQIVQPYADAQMFMGSVLVAQHGKAIFGQSYGMADLEWSIPNSSTTRFNIASMTKQFTAAAVLLLEDRGKLKTDDSIRKYFPEAPASWDKITIYNLLTHTSGISDDAATYVPGTPDKMIFHDKPLNFQPGEKWSYVNMGYLVLGYLIEKISGQTYEEFLKENYFSAAGHERFGARILRDHSSTPRLRLLARRQWVGERRTPRYEAWFRVRGSIFNHRGPTSLGGAAVRRQGAVACVFPQDDYAIQERLCLRVVLEARQWPPRD